MRRSLLTIALALTSSGFALAAGSTPASTPAPTHSVTCTAAPLAPWLNCFYEQPFVTLGSLEVDGGAYLELQPATSDVVSLAPYLDVAQYRDTYAWFVELRLPKLGGVPVLGINDPIRVGFTYRW